MPGENLLEELRRAGVWGGCNKIWAVVSRVVWRTMRRPRVSPAMLPVVDRVWNEVEDEVRAGVAESVSS
jgi:hypothetical protein